MAFRFEAGESVAEGVRRLVRHQINRALRRLDQREDAEVDKVVHETRKRLKKLRALVRLASGTLGTKLADRAGHRFRNLARPLSEVRDAEALLATLETLAEHSTPDGSTDALDAARTRLRHHRDEVQQQALAESDILSSLTDALHQAQQDSGRWELRSEGWAALAPGLGQIYRRGRRALGVVSTESPTADNFHELRKRVKDLWSALELLHATRPGPLGARSELAHTLADRLGDDHDLAVLRAVLLDPNHATPGADFGPLLPVIDARRAALQREALDLGHRLYAERPRDFDARLQAYWVAWQAEHEATQFDRDQPSAPDDR